MATPTWPATLPQKPLSRGWVWKPQDNRVVFKPDVGAEIARRRGTAVAYDYSAVFPPLTDTQLAAFETWYHGDLYSGAVHYLWNDPVSGTSFKWRIKEYQINSLGAGWHELSMQMSRLPGAAV